MVENSQRCGRDITVQEIEQFFYKEAALLDEWRLKDWLGILTEDVRSEVPALDRPKTESKNSIHVIGDNLARVSARVTQLLDGTILAETPPSHTRRLITNVRIVEVNGDDLEVAANFAVYRYQHEKQEVFVGRYENLLVLRGGEIKIRRRRAVLDMLALRPHGKITIIV